MKLRALLELASPTPGCECDTCRAIRIARGELTRADLARAGSHSETLKSSIQRPAYRKSVPTADGNTVYNHENGWLIVRDVRDVRDWDWVRGAVSWSLKVSWLVISNNYTSFQDALNHPVCISLLLRDAAKWCDENPRVPA